MAKKEKTKKQEILEMTDEQRDEILKNAIAARKVRMEQPENREKAERAAVKIAAGMRPTVEEFEALTGVMFSHHMTEKMLGILALSSNCFSNPRCLARMRAGVGICAECFAAGIEMARKEVFQNTAYNAKTLSAEVLPLEVLPIIDADELRIEAFGDTINWEHAANYMNFARINPYLTVTAWTKNPDHYKEAIRRGYTKPDNFILIYSSLELNKPATINPEYEQIIDKRFTVYTLDWLMEQGEGANYINCGGRSCKNCQRCYKNADKTAFDVRELLKKDAKKAAKLGGAWAKWDDVPAVDLQPDLTGKAAEILKKFGW